MMMPFIKKKLAKFQTFPRSCIGDIKVNVEYTKKYMWFARGRQK